MKYLVFLLASLITIISCKTAKKEKGKGLISVTSLVKKEVADIDTSLYSIIKVVTVDTAKGDTTYIPREKFGDEAADFLNLPDFSDPGVAKRFKEDNLYDSLIDRVILTYTPVDPKNEEIQKVELLVSTDIMSDGNNKVTNIIIEKGKTDRNGSYSKKLLWITGKKFLITYSAQKPAAPEQITVTKVIWNDDVVQ